MHGRHDYLRVRWADSIEALDQASNLERLVRTPLFHRLQSFCRDSDGDFFAEFGNEKRLLLEVYMAAAFTGRVEFGGTRPVRIPPANLGALTCYFTSPCHNRHTIHRCGRSRNCYIYW